MIRFLGKCECGWIFRSQILLETARKLSPILSPEMAALMQNPDPGTVAGLITGNWVARCQLNPGHSFVKITVDDE